VVKNHKIYKLVLPPKNMEKTTRRGFLKAGIAGGLATALSNFLPSEAEAAEPLRQKYLRQGPGATYEALYGSMTTGFNYNGLHMRHNGYVLFVPPNGRHDVYIPRNPDKELSEFSLSGGPLDLDAGISLGSRAYNNCEVNAIAIKEDEELYLEFGPGCEFGNFQVPRSNPNGYANVQIKMTAKDGGWVTMPSGIFVRNLKLNNTHDGREHSVIIPFGSVQISSGNINILYQGYGSSIDDLKEWSDTPTGGPRQSANFFVKVAPNKLYHFDSGKMRGLEEPGLDEKIMQSLPEELRKKSGV